MIAKEDELTPMKVCFILTHVPNPRINKRIEVFKSVADTKVICTRRASQNIWEPTQEVEHIIFDIDLPSAKHIAKRYIVSQGFHKKALASLYEFKPNVLYVEGMDSLLIACQYKKKNDVRIIYEVADLRENYLVKPKNYVERAITKALLHREEKAFNNVDFLVVTSPKFYDMHYSTLIPKERMLFIPNMPDDEVFKEYKKKQGGRFTVGFIGGIRYLKQMKMLVDASIEVGFDVLFAGAGGTKAEYDEIRKYCEGKENIFFTGRYNYDTEIAELYGRVDCIFSVYDADNPNVRIALPNKLYESIICELPIIVAKGTYLAELVQDWGVGVVVSHKDINDLENIMRILVDKADFYNNIISNCKKMKDRFDLTLSSHILTEIAKE